MSSGSVAGWGEHGNEYSGYIKCADFFTNRATIRFSKRNRLHGVIQGVPGGMCHTSGECPLR